MLKKSLITTAVGGIISIGSFLGFQFNSEQDCVKLADELQVKAKEQTLLPDEYATLRTINELGCGMLTGNPVEIVNIDEIISDGSEFIYYTKEDYNADKLFMVRKLKNKEEFDWTKREPQKLASILTYELQKRGGVTLNGKNISEQIENLLLP